MDLIIRIVTSIISVFKLMIEHADSVVLIIVIAILVRLMLKPIKHSILGGPIAVILLAIGVIWYFAGGNFSPIAIKYPFEPLIGIAAGCIAAWLASDHQ